VITLVAFLVLLACVFGGYLLAGGSLHAILVVLPFELLIIGGAAGGSFVMANSTAVVKQAVAGIRAVLRGPRFGKQEYLDLLGLLYALVRLSAMKGAIGLESHIENPQDSGIFQRYPRILAHAPVVEMICDYMRMIGMNADDPHQVEDLMARELRKDLHEELQPALALQTMADALPALGIIAAVLGVIKTMSHIDQPPSVLGSMIAGALVGTFLGVLLAYGLVGPLASRLRGVIEEEARFHEVIRAVLVAHLYGHAAQVSVETGRKMAPRTLMPSFDELERTLAEIRVT
jgi:chemotaxis protein MotA